MIKFIMKDGRLQMNETFLMIPEFVAIWEWDKTKNKNKANQLLFYVYLMCDLSEDCPTKNVEQRTKDSNCRYLAFKSKDYEFTDKEKELILPAIDAYTLYNEGSEERTIKVYDDKIDELQHLLSETKPEIMRELNQHGTVTFTSNTKIITDTLKEVSNLVKAKNDLRQAVLAGMSAGHVRGQVTLSPRDKGKLRPRK